MTESKKERVTKLHREAREDYEGAADLRARTEEAWRKPAQQAEQDRVARVQVRLR